MDRSLLRAGAKFNVELLRVTPRSGNTFEREVIRHPGSVIILPILPPDDSSPVPRIVLIRNYRLSLEAPIIELPAGTMTTGEEPAACAARELEEETGFTARTLTHLTSFYTAPGLTDELMHAYVATNLAPTRQRLEVDESIQVLPTPAPTALAMIHSSQIRDAKTMLLLLLARDKGLFVTP